MNHRKLEENWRKVKEYMGMEEWVKELELWISTETKGEIIDYLDEAYDILDEDEGQ